MYFIMASAEWNFLPFIRSVGEIAESFLHQTDGVQDHDDATEHAL
jgi:hypothetical protein